MAKKKTVTIKKEFELSEADRTERAKEAVRLTAELDKLDEEFTDSRAQWRKRIKDVKSLRDAKNQAFMIGTEPRELECTEEICLNEKVAKYYFEGKHVDTRELTIDELERHGHTPLFAEEEETAEEATQETFSENVADVMKQETNRRTKKDIIQ